MVIPHFNFFVGSINSFKRIYEILLINTVIVLFLEIIVRYYDIGNPSNKFLYNHIIPKRLPYYKFTHLKENENIVFLNNHGFHDFDRELKNVFKAELSWDNEVKALTNPKVMSIFNLLNGQ